MKRRFPLTFLFLSYFLLEVILLNGIPGFSFGSVSLYVLDIISILLVFITIFIILIAKLRINKMDLPIYLFGVLIVVSFLRGLQLYGIETAANSLRNYLYFYAPLLAIVVIGWNAISLPKLIHAWGLISWLIFGIVLIRWTMVAIGSVQNPDWVAPGGGMVRVINAAQTFFLLQTVIFVFSIPKGIKLMPFQRALPWVLIPTIVVLQHRTIWVILLFILIWFAIKTKKVLVYLPLLIIGFVIIFALILNLFENNRFLESIMGSAQDLQNFRWRMESWRQLLSTTRNQSFIDYVFGQPFGAGFFRYMFDSSYSSDTAPHNYFVETFLSIGIIGLFLFILIYLRSLTLLKRYQRYLATRPFFLLLISQLLFFLTYSPNYEQGLLLGSALLLNKSLDDHRLEP